MQAKSVMTLLSEHPFFKGFSSDYLEIIAREAKDVHYETGDIIFRQWEKADAFYLIYRGEITLEILSVEPKSIPIQTLKEGDVLGWSWLVEPYSWSFTAEVKEFTQALAIDGSFLRQKCEEDKAFGYEMMKRFSHLLLKRLQATRQTLLKSRK